MYSPCFNNGKYIRFLQRKTKKPIDQTFFCFSETFSIFLQQIDFDMDAKLKQARISNLTEKINQMEKEISDYRTLLNQLKYEELDSFRGKILKDKDTGHIIIPDRIFCDKYELANRRCEIYGEVLRCSLDSPYNEDTYFEWDMDGQEFICPCNSVEDAVEKINKDYEEITCEEYEKIKSKALQCLANKMTKKTNNPEVKKMESNE